MAWSSKRFYPVSAHCTVTVKATEFQRAAWRGAAKRMGMPAPGPFLAWAADMAIAFLEAHGRVQDEHIRERER